MSYIFPFFFKRAGRGQLGRGHREDVMNLSIKTGGGGGGSAGKGWGFDKFKNFLIKFPRVGNERSIKNVKKAPTSGEKI